MCGVDLNYEIFLFCMKSTWTAFVAVSDEPAVRHMAILLLTDSTSRADLFHFVLQSIS